MFKESWLTHGGDASTENLRRSHPAVNIVCFFNVFSMSYSLKKTLIFFFFLNTIKEHFHFS